MAKIFLGRYGEENLYAFDLDDIKKGAVRESGFFPELYKSPWPAVTSGALVTGVERKFSERRLALTSYDFPLFHPSSLLLGPLEDSKEEALDPRAIARSKLYTGFLGPVFNCASNLDNAARRDFYAQVAARAHVNDIGHLVAIADDRSEIVDDEFLKPLYGPLENHPNEQVREIFAPGHDVPGQRVKETDGARLGILNSVYLWHQAAQELRKKGVQFDEKHRMDTILCFVPVVPGAIPLPEQGLIIKAEGFPCTLRELTQGDIEKFHKGRIFTYDHFGKPEYPGLPNWMTVHDYKRALVTDQTQEERKIYEGLDKQKVLYYLTEVHSAGAAMTAFAYAVGLPGVSSAPSGRLLPSKSEKKPQTLWTNGRFLTKPPDWHAIRDKLGLPPGVKLSGYRNGGLDHLRKLEEAVYSGQAFAILNPEKFPASGKSADEVKLIRQLETSLIYAYLITMSTQHGALNHVGRPHLVEKEWYKKWGLWHPDFCNLQLTGDAEQEAYWLWENKEEFKEGLRRHYDKTLYHHVVNLPGNDFKTKDEIIKILGVDNLGFVVANYGSATGFAAETYFNPFRITNELSRWEGVTTVDGGGVRSGMLGMREGALQAIKEGYEVRNIGIRSEGDVSPLEGDIVKWFRIKGFKPSDDSPHAGHLHFANEQLHILRFQRILPRQAAIAALADVATISDGGKGTVLEFFIMALHNARVNLNKGGLFDEDCNRPKPIVLLNRKIEIMGIKRGIFDILLEPWRNHFDIMGVKEFTGRDPVPQALRWMRKYGRSLGFDLLSQKPQGGQNPVTITTPAPSADSF